MCGIGVECAACYGAEGFVLYCLYFVDVGVGGDWGPYCIGIFDYGAGDGFLSGN